MKTHHILPVAVVLFPFVLAAQTPSIPGVPEPGITIWGTVSNAVNGQPLGVASASWTLTDGTTSMTLTSTPPNGTGPKPYVRIITQGTQAYYLMQVPFDTRTLGSGAGTVNLADPNTQPDPERRYPSFPLKSASPPTYTMTPTINGAIASVKSVDGVAVPGTPGSVTVPGLSNPAFITAERGRLVRVDLTITPVADAYDTWAAQFFSPYPSVIGAQSADADGDGQTNAAEFTAGTNPIQSASVLRILTITRAADGASVNVGWTSISGKKYQIETSVSVQGVPAAWSPVGSQATASGNSTVLPAAASAAEATRFFRVKVVP